ncbi:MAG: hypothetical protein HWE22_15035 [Flavobacteriales bacterium]|nr:hypothetical protein [Flavobacteriales bacterium]
MRPAHIKEQRKKEVRRIWKERRKLWKEKCQLPLIKLEKPIRHGWYKEIVLTENLDRYKSKPEVEEIFEVLCTYYWGRTKEECQKHWNAQRSKSFIYKDVPTISKKQFNQLSSKAQRICTPFQYREEKRLRTRFYIRFPHSAYRIKFTRAYNTHRKMLDPDLESRLDVLDERLLSPGMYEANQALCGCNWHDDWQTPETKRSRIKTKNKLGRFKNTSAQDVIQRLEGLAAERSRSQNRIQI